MAHCILELIEPEEIVVTAHIRSRKLKMTYEEQFDKLSVRQVPLDTLSVEEKSTRPAAQKWYRFGVKSSRGTIAHWTIYCSQNYFTPMLRNFRHLLMRRRFVAADMTPI